MFIAIPFQFDSQMIVERIAKYKKRFANVKKNFCLRRAFSSLRSEIIAKLVQVENSNAVLGNVKQTKFRRNLFLRLVDFNKNFTGT